MWAVAVAVVLVFAPSITHEFAGFDDSLTLISNPHLNPPTLQGLAWHWTHPHLALYIPVTYSAWWGLAKVACVSVADETGAHLNPWVFHGASVLLHAATAVLVFQLLRRLIHRPIPAAIGALAFALHPIQVETVAWASGMKDLLFAFFSVLALLAYERAVRSRGIGERWRSTYVLGTLALLAAMLSKPTAMVTPLLAIVIDRMLLVRPWKKVLAMTWPWLAMSLICGLAARLNQPAALAEPAPLWARPLIALDALAFYLWKWIVPLNFGPDYGRRPQYVMQQWWFWLTWLVPVAAGLAVGALGRKHRWLGAGAAMILLPLLPTLGLVSFEFQGYSTVADHYFYLPMLGMALVLCNLAAFPRQRSAGAIVVVLLLAWGALSVWDHRAWANDVTLWNHAARVNPRSWIAHEKLAEHAYDRGDLAEAELHLRRAVATAAALPGAADPFATRVRLAHVLAAQNKHGEAVEQLMTAMAAWPGDADKVRLAAAKRAAAETSLIGACERLEMSLKAPGHHEEAAAAYKKAMSTWRGDPEVKALIQLLVREP